MRAIDKVRIYCRIEKEYPDCRIQFTGPHSAVVISEGGRWKRVVFRRRIVDKPLSSWITLSSWLIPAVIWMAAMLMAMTLVAMAALGQL